MPVYKAEGIVIRRGNLGEADRLVTLLCRDQGKVTAAAKGARKPKSRFAGRLELFSHVRVLLAVGRTLDVVSQVEVATAFAALRENLDRLAYAALTVELADRATADREPAPDLFRVLRTALDPRQRTEVGGLLQGYAEYRLETKLKSPLVIQKLLKAGTPTPASPARGGARERGNGGTRTR